MKKLISAVLCAMLLLGVSPFAFAAAEERIDLGNGFYMIIEQEHSDISLYAIRGKSKTASVYYTDTKVGTMTVTAEFDYNYSTVSVSTKSCIGAGISGWTASNNYATGSGGTVTGYCTFSKGSSKTTANLSISCDKNGNIS